MKASADSGFDQQTLSGENGLQKNILSGFQPDSNYETQIECFFNYGDEIKQTDILKFSGRTGSRIESLELTRITSLQGK